MPVDFNVRDSKTPHDIYCDYCGILIGAVDEGYIQHFGFNTKRPKISLRCNLCDKHQIENNFRTGCLIRGFGRVDPRILDEREIMNQIENASLVKAEAKVNWEEVDATIKAGRVTTSALAAKYGVAPATMKSLLVARYGNNLDFKKGRSGGVQFKTN